ncbi:manganese catalase family protein, partial [Paenibacillus oralis]
KGSHPSDGERLEVVRGVPQGGEVPDLEEVPEQFAPGISNEDFMQIAQRLQKLAGL